MSDFDLKSMIEAIEMFERGEVKARKEFKNVVSRTEDKDLLLVMKGVLLLFGAKEKGSLLGDTLRNVEAKLRKLSSASKKRGSK
jgi:hypothetical protein